MHAMLRRRDGDGHQLQLLVASAAAHDEQDGGEAETPPLQWRGTLKSSKQILITARTPHAWGGGSDDDS